MKGKRFSLYCSTCGKVHEDDSEYIIELWTRVHLLVHILEMLTDPHGVYVRRPQ